MDYRLYANLIEPGFEYNQPPPAAPLRPHLYSIENDPTFRQLSTSKFKAALEEYQLLTCHGFFQSCSVAALGDLVAEMRASGAEEFAEKVEAACNSFAVTELAVRQRLSYIRLAKGQAKPTQSDQLFAEHLRAAFQPSPSHLGCATTAALYEQFRAKEIECSLAAAAKAAAGKKFSASTSAAPTPDPSPHSGPKPNGRGRGKGQDREKAKDEAER